jgi:hypothetical protein
MDEADFTFPPHLHLHMTTIEDESTLALTSTIYICNLPTIIFPYRIESQIERSRHQSPKPRRPSQQKSIAKSQQYSVTHRKPQSN